MDENDRPLRLVILRAGRDAIGVDETPVDAKPTPPNKHITPKPTKASKSNDNRPNVNTRVRVLSSGRTIGGVALTNGPIFHILTNRHYIGQVTYRDTFWPSEHWGIIEPDIFAQVQHMLAARRQIRVDKNARSGAMLIGKIFNEGGEKMSPNLRY